MEMSTNVTEKTAGGSGLGRATLDLGLPAPRPGSCGRHVPLKHQCPPKFICSSPNPQDLTMWLHLEEDLHRGDQGKMRLWSEPQSSLSVSF